MQKLLEKDTIPPDGMRYFQAETRTWIRAADYLNLFIQVREHRLANNLPLPTFWEAEVEDQLCHMLPPGLCKEQNPAQTINTFTRISWEQVVGGTRTLVDWAAHGLTKVSQELADSRANICTRCYYNVAIGGVCGSCGHLQNLAAQFTHGRRTPSDPFLRACAVCHCSLQVKIWVPVESIDKGTPEESLNKYPEFCWQKQELLAYRATKNADNTAK